MIDQVDHITDGDITEYRGHRIAPCKNDPRSLGVHDERGSVIQCGLPSIAYAAAWIASIASMPRRRSLRSPRSWRGRPGSTGRSRSITTSSCSRTERPRGVRRL
jgi:hypothetical protein